MKLSFSSINTMKIHNIITFMLFVAISFQGFLVKFRFADQPLWSLILILTVPFIPNYIKLFIRLPFKIKVIYFCFLLTATTVSCIAIFINGEIYNYDRLLIPCIGIYISYIIFFNFRENISLFIKQAAFLIGVMAVFSLMQFYFDYNFFEFFTRKHESYSESGELIVINRDMGSSGGFGFPVPYGYFLAFYLPIIYAYFLKSFSRHDSLVKKTIYCFVPIFLYISLLFSMQRAAILTVLVSILMISFIALKFKKALIIFILLPISTQIVFNAMQGEYSRILNKDNLFHNSLNIESGGFNEKYRGGKVLFDLSAIKSRLSYVYIWHKAFENIKSQNLQPDSKTETNTSELNRDILKETNWFKTETNTYKIHRDVVKEIKLRSTTEALFVPNTPHNYLLNIDMNYGRIALISVLLCYFSMVVQVARIALVNKERRFLSFGYLMAITNYLLVGLVHNNGHFLLDIAGWCGLGLVVAYIYKYSGNN
jgi:hypothetical protein